MLTLLSLAIAHEGEIFTEEEIDLVAGEIVWQGIKEGLYQEPHS